MFTFNNNNIITGYIKELLYAFNFPMFSVLKKGDQLIPYNTYLFKRKIYLYTGENIATFSGEILNSTFSFVRDYIANEEIPNLTNKFIISNTLYDSYTHEKLGEYLRFLRDYENVNLMPLYNCFSNRIPTNLNINISNTSSNIIFNSYDEKYTIYTIPIKFNQDYYICIDSNLPIELCCCFYDNTLLLTSDQNNENELHRNFIQKTYQKINSSIYKIPLRISKIVCDNIILGKFQKHLKLCIKIPRDLNSSISVLEGDYSLFSNTYLSDGVIKESTYIKTNKQTNVFPCRLFLLENNIGESIPFSDRLLEYLFDNAISPLSEIDNNIVLVQNFLERKKLISKDSITRGEWSENMRDSIFHILQINGMLNNYKDLLFYVDKDVEKQLGIGGDDTNEI